MAASTRRMNGMAGVLLLCALLLSNEVRCQDDAAADATDAPAADAAADPTDAADAADPTDAGDVADAAGDAAAADATAAPDAGAAPTAAAGEGSAASAAPGDGSLLMTIVNIALNPEDGGDSGTSVTAAAPAAEAVAPVVVENNPVIELVVPAVTCVGQDDISESSAVKVEVATDDCEATKRIIEENPAAWCTAAKCDLKIFQKDKTALVASDAAQLSTLAGALQSERLKEKLGLTKVETPPSSSGSSVFVGILVSGLLAAIAITVGYFKCQRKSDTKGLRLAEETYPVDQENQGNTLVSVAPLNPPPETQEKPSVNGESPEDAKTQPPPPPTNGHSTAKTADTEM